MQGRNTHLTWKRRLVPGMLGLCAALAALGAAEMVVRPSAPRWLGLCTVALILLSVALAGRYAWLRQLPRQGFRILRAKHVLHFRKGTDADPGIRIHMRSASEFESLGPGQSALTLQKFVAEPTSLSGETTLEEWKYSGTVDGAAQTARATISPSRSVQIAFDLGRELREGEVVALTEELDVAADPFERSMTLAFQSPHPAEAQVYELRFEGIRPMDAEFRVERGSGTLHTGPIPVEDISPTAWRMTIKQGRARPGDQLVLCWQWDPATMPSESDVTERLLAEAQERQRQVAAILAAEFETEEGAATIESLVVVGDDIGEGESADDHPIIKAARAREAAIQAANAPAKSSEDKN